MSRTEAPTANSAESSYYRARYYDQNAGRFLGEDQIGFAGGANFYTYVGNDPVDNTDRFGLSPDDVQRIISLANQIMNQMTNDQERSAYGSNINNILSTLQMKGLWPKPKNGKPYLGCGQQADKVLNGIQFPSKPYDDHWTFGIVDVKSGWIPIFPHQIGVAHSDNPNDPDIIIDPWKNRIFPVPQVKLPLGPNEDKKNECCKK